MKPLTEEEKQLRKAKNLAKFENMLRNGFGPTQKGPAQNGPNPKLIQQETSTLLSSLNQLKLGNFSYHEQ